MKGMFRGREEEMGWDEEVHKRDGMGRDVQGRRDDIRRCIDHDSELSLRDYVHLPLDVEVHLRYLAFATPFITKGKRARAVDDTTALAFSAYISRDEKWRFIVFLRPGVSGPFISQRHIPTRAYEQQCAGSRKK
jgi:hypothetical protein